MPELPIQVTDLLDSMALFGGHNGFLNGHDKEEAVQLLRIAARLPNPPSPESVEDYLNARNNVSKQHRGAWRARKALRRDPAGQAPSAAAKAVR